MMEFVVVKNKGMVGASDFIDKMIGRHSIQF